MAAASIQDAVTVASLVSTLLGLRSVKETYRQEGVSHEAAYLIGTRNGWILVFAAELEDREKARAAYQASTLPIDVEHRRVIQATLNGAFEAELVYECHL